MGVDETNSFILLFYSSFTLSQSNRPFFAFDDVFPKIELNFSPKICYFRHNLWKEKIRGGVSWRVMHFNLAKKISVWLGLSSRGTGNIFWKAAAGKLTLNLRSSKAETVPQIMRYVKKERIVLFQFFFWILRHPQSRLMGKEKCKHQQFHFSE